MRQRIAIVQMLYTLGLFTGLLLQAALLCTTTPERRLPLSTSGTPLTSAVTCGTKRRLILYCDGANSAGVAAGRPGGLASGAALLWVIRNDRDWGNVCGRLLMQNPPGHTRILAQVLDASSCRRRKGPSLCW